MSDDQDPAVLRGPHGFTFVYSECSLPAEQDPAGEPEAFDPSKHLEWVAWMEENARNAAMMAEARRVDPMPDPEKLTVGEMIDFIAFIARVSHQDFQELLAMPEVRQQCNRREIVLSASPGWKAFEQWRDIEHHRKTPLEAANELLALLVDRLHEPSKELRLMPLLAAVHLLGQLETVSPPEASETNQAPAAAPASGSKAALTPGARAVAAAYDLQKERKPISIRAACDRAAVDRAHLRDKYPEAVDAIRRMKTPGRSPRAGLRDKRTGDIDAVDDSDD
jgi:hypothetical protein